MHNKNIRLADMQDVNALVKLINSAYRSNMGWTHEHGIVQGERISAEQLKVMLSQPNVDVFVLEMDDVIFGCIGLTIVNQQIEIGSFAIDPFKQNSGYGKELLDFAELQAAQKQGIEYLTMSVLNVRHELIAYYERRGYSRTGHVEEYPLDANVGVPQVALHLSELRKWMDITKSSST